MSRLQNVAVKRVRSNDLSFAALPIHVDPEAIARFCCERGIRRLALFGSALREDFAPNSDVDLLVEYLPERHPGLMLFRHQDELAARWNRPVDLHTLSSISRHFRAKVAAEAAPIYEQA